MINEIKPLKVPYCQKILPLVYDDSLSYYEAICKFQSKLIYSIEPKLISSFDVFSHLRWYRIDKQFNKRKKITFVNVADSVLESIKWFKPMIMRIYRSYRYGTSNRFSREQQFCIDNKAFIPNFIDTASLTGALNRLTAFTIAMKERHENNNIRSYTS